MQRSSLRIWGLGLFVAGYGVLLSCGGSSSGQGSPFNGGGTGSNVSSGDNNSGDLDGGPSSGFQGSSGSNGSAGSSVSSGSAVNSGSIGSPTTGSSGSSGTTGDDATTEETDATVTITPTQTNGGTTPSSMYLPTVSGTCPSMTTGTQMFAGEPVQLWTGSKTGSQTGSLVFYWYGTGGSSSDVEFEFGASWISTITSQGGIVASFGASKKTGTDTGDGVWYTDDFLTADQVVACALKDGNIDPRRIYPTGASAGALQSTWMSYARSGYVAAVATLSGGLTGIMAGSGFLSLDPQPQDSTHLASVMATHGATGVDVVVIDFAKASAAWEADIAKRGGFSLDCNTGGGHVSGPPAICPAIWQFFEDHPFGVKPQPYPPIPAVFPSYCKIGPRLADGGAP
jgi:hypothetical protein